MVNFDKTFTSTFANTIIRNLCINVVIFTLVKLLKLIHAKCKNKDFADSCDSSN